MIRNKENISVLLSASLTLFWLANIIIAEIQRVSEIRIEDIESNEKASEVCSKVANGLKRWVKEIKLAKARPHNFKYQEKLLLDLKTKGTIKTNPNTSEKRTWRRNHFLGNESWTQGLKGLG